MCVSQGLSDSWRIVTTGVDWFSLPVNAHRCTNTHTLWWILFCSKSGWIFLVRSKKRVELGHAHVGMHAAHAHCCIVRGLALIELTKSRLCGVPSIRNAPLLRPRYHCVARCYGPLSSRWNRGIMSDSNSSPNAHKGAWHLPFS